MAVQFDRKIKITVFKNSGEGIEFTDNCMSFDILRTRVGEPNKGVFTIHNLSLTERNSLTSKEFQRVRCEAGYPENQAIIFDGKIRIIDPIDAWDADVVTRFEAAEGDVSYRRSTMNETIPAGTSAIQQARRALRTFLNVSEGDLSCLKEQKVNHRPIVVSGPTKEFLDDLVRTYDARWTINNNVLDIICNDEALQTFAPLKNDCTGLKFNPPPQVIENGIKFTCQMDPALKPNGLVVVENSLDNTVRSSQGSIAVKGDKVVQTDNASGTLRINTVRQLGDNYSGPWDSIVEGQKIVGAKVVREDNQTLYGGTA